MAANPILKDLSGHGFDAECRNFNWNEQSGVDTNGYLQFDGVKDLAVCLKDFVLTDFTLIMRRSCSNNSDGYPCSAAKYTRNRPTLAFESIENHNGYARQCYSFGAASPITINRNFNTVYMTPTSYNGQRLNRGSLKDSTETKFCIAKAFPTHSVNMQLCMADCLLFDSTLTAEQIQWVKDNLID